MTVNIKSLLQTALGVLSTFAKYTDTTLDDTAVSVLTAVLGNDDLMRLIESIFSDPAVQAANGEARTSLILDLANRRRDNETEAAAESAGLGWVALIQALPVIIRLLLTLSGKRS